MASTNPVPIVLTVTHPHAGKIQWTPDEHTQEHLRALLSHEDTVKLDEINDALKSMLEVLPAAVCTIVHPEILEEVRAVVGLLELVGLSPQEIQEVLASSVGDTVGPLGPDSEEWDPGF